MKLGSARYALLFFLLGCNASPSDDPKEDSPCVARSPTSGLYFDLSAISLSPPELKKGKKVSPDAREQSWHSKGHDYGANFTMNICAPVIEDVKDVVGVDSARWKNVSAYYKKDGKTYSIGEQASDPFFRGRKLVLNYTNGSPCSEESAAGSGNSSIRTKSTLMTFLCDRDAIPDQATPSFVGTMDSCTYFFEVRSSAACGGLASDPHGKGLGPGGVFGVIMLIAVAAYFVGGCAYQRTVMHQRGWRQCPNFSLWAGMFDFVKDIAIIAWSSLSNSLRLKRAPSSNNGVAHAYAHRHSGSTRLQGTDVDAENRLIDQLDEEWEE